MVRVSQKKGVKMKVKRAASKTNKRESRRNRPQKISRTNSWKTQKRLNNNSKVGIK